MSPSPRQLSVKLEQFRAAMSRLAAGVSIVTSSDASGEPHGMTATAVCSVSLDPPLVLASLSVRSTTRAVARDSGRFALNFLGRGDEAVARRFARSGGDKFEELDWFEGATGCPILSGALASCECTTEQIIEAGDHTVFIGRVDAVSIDVDAANDPLIYFAGAYGALSGRRAR